MLKQSENAIGMLLSKYRSVLKKMFVKNAVVLAAASCFLFAASPALAATYEVGEGKQYSTLNDLRKAGAIKDGDTVIVYGSDSSLDDRFKFNGFGFEGIDRLYVTFEFRNNQDAVIEPTFSNDKFIQLQGFGDIILKSGDYNVTLKKFNTPLVTLTETWGGVICTRGTVNVEGNFTFAENDAEFRELSNGGAVLAETGANIKGSNTFELNYAHGSGGAIYSEGVVNVEGSNKFLHNLTNTYAPSFLGGGAIYAEVVNITGENIFEGNEASAYGGHSANGGAIYAVESVTVDGSNRFSSNSAGASGGAIYAKGTITITGNNTFEYNRAYSDGTDASTDGGAIYGVNTINISGANVFNRNEAKWSGGAVSGDDVTVDGSNKFTFNKVLEKSSNADGNEESGYSSGGAINGIYTVKITGDNLFQGNETMYSGGAIYSRDEVTITGGNNGGNVFLDNAAHDDDGGAIDAKGIVTVSGTNTFSGNSAAKNGGAIHGGGNITLSGTNTFSGNSATVSGGAIYDGGNVSLSGTNTFSGNSAAKSGGAVYSDGKVTLQGSNTFSGNSAANNGGAIYTSYYDVSISDPITFEKNKATMNGGAIYSSGKVNLNADSRFESNAAQGDGGAISSTGGVTIKSDNTFANNTAQGIGGAIYSANGITLSGSNTFSGNSSGGSYGGGAIFNLGTANISGNNIFSFNSAKGGGDGGAIYSSYNSLSGTNKFESNTAGNNGGAIYTRSGIGLNGDIEFKNNIANNSGGAIYVPETVSIYGHATFLSNRAKSGDGGAIYSANIYFNSDNNTFSTNTSYGSGGAIYGSNEIILSDFNTFESNLANGHGGAIYSAGAVSVNSNNTFSKNTSYHDGGAIYTKIPADDNVAIVDIKGDNNTFSQNEAINDGGAIYGVNVSISGNSNVFADNEAKYSGGAIYSNKKTGDYYYDWSYVNISGDNNVFAGNIASKDGGAIYNYGVTEINGNGNTFLNNSAAGYGGAIYNAYYITLSGGEYSFANNAAGKSGGAIYVKDALRFSNNSNIFKNNTAGDYGGAIYSDYTVITEITSNNTFENNSAKISGGAISSSHINNDGVSIFTNNSAGNDGGAVHASQSINSAGSFLFKNNTTGNNGGAVYVYNSINSTGSLLFENNTAGNNGGAIYNGAELYGSYLFRSNSAQNSGGAIYANTRVVVRGAGEFENNSAVSGLGGAIYVYASTNSYDSSAITADEGDIIFKGNTAAGNPNAVFVYNRNDSYYITLGAKESNTLYFYDPVENNPSYLLNVDINKSSGKNTYTGTVLFDRYLSNIYGNTTVYNGVMQLNNGAVYGSGGSKTSFTLANGATLRADAGGNKVQADKITLENGSILSFDMDGATDTTVNLTLEGKVSGQYIGQGIIDIYSDNKLTEGTYTLVRAANANISSSKSTLSYNGQTDTKEARQLISLELLPSILGITKQLKLHVGQLENTTLKWTGQDGFVWDELGAKNWEGKVGDKDVTQFLAGDSVVFDNSGADRIIFDGMVIVDGAGVTVAGMTVDNSAERDYYFRGGIISGGSLTKDGGGVLTLANANDFSGTTLNAGRINIGNNQALGLDGALAMSDATTLGFNGNYSIANNINIASGETAVFNTALSNTSAAITGSISGGSFEKTGAGTLTVGNTSVENVDISEGTLKIETGKQLTATGELNLADNTVLSFTAGDNPAAIVGNINCNYDSETGGILDINGYIRSEAATGSVKLIERIGSATNTPVLYIAPNTDAPRYTIGGNDSVDFLSVEVWKDTTGIFADIILSWYDDNQSAFSGEYLGQGTFTLDNPDGSFTVRTALNDRTDDKYDHDKWDGRTLTKDGGGTLILTGNNTYSGGTKLNAGSIGIGSDSALGTGALTMQTNTTLGFAGNHSVNNNIILNGNAAVDTEGYRGELNGIIGGDGALTKKGEGKLTLTNANTYMGNTIIEGGALTATNVNALGKGASEVTVKNSAILEFDLNSSESGIFDKKITVAGENGELESGNLIKSGNGILTLANANNDYSGSITVNNGLLRITAGGEVTLGAVENNAQLNFVSSTNFTHKNINIGIYSGSGTVGLQASLTSPNEEDQWSDYLTFATAPTDSVNVHFSFEPGSKLRNMPATGLSFAPLTAADGNNTTFSLDGASFLAGSYLLNIETNDTGYVLTSAFIPSLAKMYSEVSAATMAQASGMHGRELFDATSQAAKSADGNSTGIYAGFGKTDARYKTGSHADVEGNNFAIALAWQANEKTAWGVFGQMFNGSYTTSNEALGQNINSNGDLDAHDFGLFAEYRPAGQKADNTGHYYKAVVRAGRSSNDFRANNYMGGLSTFRSGRNLFGLSLGGGYVKNSGQDRTVEYYTHLIYTGLGGDNATDSAGQDISFNSDDSLRLLSGMRLNLAKNKKTGVYLGAALDYEFCGKTNAYVDGYKADSADLKGLTGIFEFGLSFKQSKTFTIDGGLNGYVGKKKGFGGTLTVSKKF